MLGSIGAPLMEKFFVRRLSANFTTLILSACAPGIVADTCRISLMSAEKPWAFAGAARAATRISARKVVFNSLLVSAGSIDRKTIEKPSATCCDQIHLAATLRAMRRIPRRIAASNSVGVAELRRALA